MAHSRLNLNLLICLYHILKEQSVSLAARRMFVTQSAMSKSLAQLREKLNDPIIVRNKGRIEITATAREMQNQVEHIVSSALLFFENASFLPERSRRRFSLLCDDITMHHLLPPLIKKLARLAPSVSVDLIPSSSDSLSQLALGNTDLALFFSQKNSVKLHSKTILNDTVVAVMGRHHPMVDKNLTEDNFTDYSFISLTPEQRGYALTHEILGSGFNQKIIARLPSVSMILDMLAQTPYIAVLPLMTLRLAQNRDHFVTKKLPFTDSVTIPLKLLWVPAQDSNIANKWLREAISKHFMEYNEI